MKWEEEQAARSLSQEALEGGVEGAPEEGLTGAEEGQHVAAGRTLADEGVLAGEGGPGINQAGGVVGAQHGG